MVGATAVEVAAGTGKVLCIRDFIRFLKKLSPHIDSSAHFRLSPSSSFHKESNLQQLQQQQPVIIPNTIQPNPPVPRHGSTPPRSNGRVHHPQQIQQQQAPPLSQQQMQNLSPIRSCSETESGSPLGMGHLSFIIITLKFM